MSGLNFKSRNQYFDILKNHTKIPDFVNLLLVILFQPLFENMNPYHNRNNISSRIESDTMALWKHEKESVLLF